MATHQPGPTGPGRPKGNPRPPKATPKTEKGQRRGSTNKAPERQNGKTGLQVMERMATDGHGLSKNKAPERQSYNTIKTTKPKVLENVTRESAGAKVTPSTLSGTLHGNAMLVQKRSAALHGSAFAEVPPSPAASRRRPSREMQNERHAAWEHFF